LPRLIVTRPAAQAVPWVQALQALGCDAVPLPLIEIQPVANGSVHMQALQQAWLNLTQPTPEPKESLVMFVSANAVQQFFAARPAATPWPAGVLAASTGPGTSAALRAAGVPDSALVQPDAQRQQWDSEALWLQLANRSWADRRILIVRGEDGRDWLADRFQAAGARVAFVTAYRRCVPTLDAAGRSVLHDAVQAPERHVWLFSSSEAVANLSQLAPTARWADGRAWVTHPRIGQAATDAGFGQVREVGPQLESVARCAQADEASAQAGDHPDDRATDRADGGTPTPRIPGS